MERLTEAASKLSPIEIRPPERVIGRHTAECVDAGVFYSSVDAIDGIVTRILEEWRPEDALVVATGGMAGLLAPHCRTVERVEPFLTLTGLAVADRYFHDRG
jgi:type III pantothenate kinase